MVHHGPVLGDIGTGGGGIAGQLVSWTAGQALLPPGSAQAALPPPSAPLALPPAPSGNLNPIGQQGPFIGGENADLARSFGVDASMIAGDEAAGVLGGKGYEINPSAQSLEALLTDSGKIVSKQMSGRFMYTVDQTSKITIGTRMGRDRMPHPTLIGGVDPRVQAAGIIDIRGGRIYSIDNASGHFKPGAGSLQAAQRAFEQLPKSAFHPKFRGYLGYDEAQ